jgi:hypothetical protein
METTLLIGALILLSMIGLQAWFSYRILREVRQESSFYRHALERQLRLASSPHLHCDIQPNADAVGMHLGLYNIGNSPAYDLHIDLIAAYAVDGMDITTFMRTFVQPRFRKYPLQPDKVGYYGIRHSLRQPLIPYQKRLEFPLKLVANPADVYVLLQYREVAGNNYHQVYCFSEVNERGLYRMNLIEPSRAELIERLHFSEGDDAKISAQEKSLPFALKAFLDLWNHSIAYRFTILEPEDGSVPPATQEL